MAGEPSYFKPLRCVRIRRPKSGRRLFFVACITPLGVYGRGFTLMGFRAAREFADECNAVQGNRNHYFIVEVGT